MFNEVTLVGRLTRDPELRYTQTGKAVCNFCVATDITTNDPKITEFINIVAWQKLADVCAQYLKKGKLVFLKGQLRSRQWEDKSGNKRKDWDVVINVLKMLSPKDANSEPSTPKTDDRFAGYDNEASSTSDARTDAAKDISNSMGVNDPTEPIDDDDVPF